MKMNEQASPPGSDPITRNIFTTLKGKTTLLVGAIKQFLKRDSTERSLPAIPSEPAADETTVAPTDEVRETAHDTRERRRSYNEKQGHTSKQGAIQQARIIVNDYHKPAWVYEDNGLYYASSYGFDITRRPDLTLTPAQIDLIQKAKSMTESEHAPEMEPSVVARFGFNGRFFRQCGRYLAPVDVGEWIAVQESPAIFISVTSDIGSERMQHIDCIRRILYNTHGIISSYRWVSIDTVVLAIKHQGTGMHPREQVENPWWFLRALNRPNAQVFKATPDTGSGGPHTKSTIVSYRNKDMVIKFKDFRDDRQTFDRGEWQSTIDMNKWLEDRDIDILSVETIFKVSGTMASTSSRFEAIRLWYKEVSPSV